MDKIVIIIVIVAVVVLGGFFLFRGAPRPVSSVPKPLSEQPATQPPVSLPPSGEEALQPPIGQPPVVEEKVVTYADAGYSPATLQIKAGDTVMFKNESSQSMWTASAIHPTHTLYPTTGGCLGSTFDACTGVQPGNNWSFRFDITGTWKYHNHLSPGDIGTIVVE